MTKSLEKVGAVLGTVLTFAAPLFVLAQQAPPLPTTQIRSVGGLIGLLCQVMNWVFIVFIIIAVIYIVLAGWKYLSAGGEADTIKEANHQLIYAVVAIAIAILARSAPFIIQSFLGGSGTQFCDPS